jgi:hypothetical protein
MIMRCSCTLLDGIRWLLEAFNKVWKIELQLHSNKGGGYKTTLNMQNTARRAKRSITTAR